MHTLQEIAERIATCRRCPLGMRRRNPVPGEGSADAALMLVGEAPGREEDSTGRPFVGRAGKLLDGVLRESGLRRDEVFITSVIKCRPPGNRRPKKAELTSCLPYLTAQIEVLQPRVVLLLGGVAAGALLNVGRVGSARGIPVRAERIYLVTYHPAAVLRNINLMPQLKEDVELAKKLAYSET